MTVRVLVIDDEPDGEILVRQEFRREVRQGLYYTLDFALSGKAALETLDDSGGEGTILLICEISAPGISGLDLLKAVKAQWRGFHETATGHGGGDDRGGGTDDHSR